MHLREVEDLRTSFNPGLGHACAGGKARERDGDITKEARTAYELEEEQPSVA